MTGAPNTTTPTPTIDASHRKSYAYTTVAGMSVVEYIGIASPGTLKSQTGWQITKFIYDPTTGQATDQLWADGSDAFDKIWNSYSSYTYTNS